MFKVCAHYCGTTILLEEFETIEEAEEFMMHDYILAYEDETEDHEEECIYRDEMFIDDDLPFSDPPTIQEFAFEYSDELPF